MGNVAQLYLVKMKLSFRPGFQGEINRWSFAHLYMVCKPVSCTAINESGCSFHCSSIETNSNVGVYPNAQSLVPRPGRVTPMCITVIAVTTHLDLDPIVREPNLAHREEESGDAPTVQLCIECG